GGQLGELAPVDDGTDLRAEVREAEEHPKTEADRDDDADDDELVGSDPQSGAEVQGAVGHETRSLAQLAGPQRVRGAEQDREDAERRDELLRRSRALALERAEDDALEQVSDSPAHADDRNGYRQPERE